MSDLKLENIFLGLMSHSSCHPCTWCDIFRADLAKKGNLRTIGSRPDACYVARECIHGGTFNGNSSKKLLENVTKLRDICPPEALAFADTLDAFSIVVHVYFGNQLSENYQADINKFKDLYLSFNISVTPKIHAEFYHVVDFFQVRQEGLGRWSEQSSESVHADFSKTWDRYKVPYGHPLYSNRLLRAVLSYNASYI